VFGGVFVVIRLVHRTGRGVHAARHPCFGRRLPTRADGEVSGAQRQDRYERRDTPEPGHRLPSMRNPTGCVKSLPVMSKRIMPFIVHSWCHAKTLRKPPHLGILAAAADNPAAAWIDLTASPLSHHPSDAP
jgi:hypothetical protein